MSSGGDVIDAYVPCDLVTCASLNGTCGPAGDGCGGQIDCGTCGSGEVCGGGSGQRFTCGAETCVPRGCAEAGASCGRVSNGCGGLTDECGTCGSDELCGAAGIANVCGTVPCTGLCLQQTSCAGSATTISGVVTAPGHADVATFGAPDPIYGALVYVPNGAAGPPGYGVTAFPSGVSCDTCSSLVSGTPLVTATSGVDGSFTLTDAPCGTDIPLVIQLGRWRREITIPSVACCAQTTLSATQTHLPRNHTGETGDVRSDIPLMAVSTGDVDTAHCVLRKLGIDDAEFTNPSGTGRVRFYRDDGAQINTTTPPASDLYDNAAELKKYDLALFECVGERQPKTLTEQTNVINFANAGGRVFATHYSYVWLTNDTGTVASNTAPHPFSQTATWEVDQAGIDTATATIDLSQQGDPETQERRVALAEWLQLVGASLTLGDIPVDVVRQDFNAVSAKPGTANGTPAQLWMSISSPVATPIAYTFDTPIAYAPLAAPTTRCGRVVYNDFHVSDATSSGDTFPSECTDGPMTPQEKTLEFMLFDLSACTGPQPSQCIPKTCADQGYDCGLSGDGCDDGVTLSCGVCENGRQCGGAGISKCGTGACVPQACAEANCGIIGDGCGGTVDCGQCGPDQTCGVDGAPNQCSTVIVK